MDGMVNKISAYEVFNVLFPGVLVTAYCLWVFDIQAVVDGILSIGVATCAAYMVGVLVSRIGSLVIEPIAKKTGLVRWLAGFYAAEKKDKKIAVLLKDMNMYRTLCSGTWICYIATIVAAFCLKTITPCLYLELIIGLTLTMVVLILSYRKQSQAIQNRIIAAGEGED